MSDFIENGLPDRVNLMLTLNQFAMKRMLISFTFFRYSQLSAQLGQYPYICRVAYLSHNTL